jgi:hypothetical protein
LLRSPQQGGVLEQKLSKTAQFSEAVYSFNRLRLVDAQGRKTYNAAAKICFFFLLSY